MTMLRHGACYYPELWPEKEIDRDIEEMKRVGLNFVRIGEFGWSTIEPSEGQVSMAFFLRVLDKLYAGGLGVVYCTPTPTPPIWLSHAHPERCLVDATGQVMSHGARQHASYEHPAVRTAALRVVEFIAAAIKDHPAVIAWQIDNEFKCHVAEDFSDAAVENWHHWLELKFGTIDQLNSAWGTDVWSERYLRFDQVPAPKLTPFLHNASLSTAYKVFNRERIADFLDAQIQIIRKYSAAPITHNFALPFSLDFERISRNLDFVSFDDYPDRSHWSAIVLDNDFCRPIKTERGHWFMETSVAHNGWLGNHEIAHPPGFLEAEAVASFALGAEAINYWLWRQQRTGCEISHSAIMSTWFKPSVGYSEVQAVEAARKKLEPILATSRVTAAEIAVTWSDLGRATLQTEPIGASAGHQVEYNAIISRWHRCLLDLGLHREIRFESADLSGLKMLVTPVLPWVSAEFLCKAEAWVRTGGIWICGPLTGLRGPDHSVPTDAGLGPLEILAGVETIFSFPISGTGSTGVAFNLEVPLAGWCSALRAGSEAKIIGSLKCELAPHLAWITERALGAGLVVILGAEPLPAPGNDFLEKLLSHYAERANLQTALSATRGTVVCPRSEKDGRRSWAVVNLDGQGGAIEVKKDLRDRVTGKNISHGSLQVGRYEWRVFTE